MVKRFLDRMKLASEGKFDYEGNDELAGALREKIIGLRERILQKHGEASCSPFGVDIFAENARGCGVFIVHTWVPASDENMIRSNEAEPENEYVGSHLNHINEMGNLCDTALIGQLVAYSILEDRPLMLYNEEEERKFDEFTKRGWMSVNLCNNVESHEKIVSKSGALQGPQKSIQKELSEDILSAVFGTQSPIIIAEGAEVVHPAVRNFAEEFYPFATNMSGTMGRLELVSQQNQTLAFVVVDGELFLVALAESGGQVMASEKFGSTPYLLP